MFIYIRKTISSEFEYAQVNYDAISTGSQQFKIYSKDNNRSSNYDVLSTGSQQFKIYTKVYYQQGVNKIKLYKINVARWAFDIINK